ncbi:hypothetical protein [Flavobacterium sp.]|uniref:hypothetical protein n=1 Tax=Flavobacterium sp. TaxID=239 RepID=UPI002B4B0180|nr:hypothetical protein [Flavobacterium sp.]HLF50902.1 hypothetical protein [Flavobacterium sp.]
MKKLLLILFIGYFSKSYSQTDYAFVYNNDSIIRKGNSFSEKEKYIEAIKEFEKISETDPKFLYAQHEKAIALSSLEKKEELKAFFEDLYKKNRMPELPTLYTLYGSFLSDEKDYVQSEKIFKEGEKYLSNSSNFLYNFAVLYIRKEEVQKSVDILKRIISNNPNHATSHYLLGTLAFENGNITEGTLALLSYLIIAPNGRFAEKAILKLNAKFGQNYLEKGKLVFSTSGDNFEEIEIILRNQLPLKSAYKVRSEIDDVIIRQVQAVAEYSVEHKMGTGFFETTYLPWIKDVIEKTQFEGFSYYILLGMEDKIGKKLTSQKKKITAFYNNYILTDFWDSFAKRNLDHFGNQQEVVVLIKNGIPYFIGPKINGKKEGKFKYLNEYGNLNGELNFKNDELNGLQKYYDENGDITEEKTFLNGKIDGTRTTYFSNGLISIIENYKDGILSKTSASYHVNGGKQCEINFTNGERDGKLICLYSNGSKKSETSYVNGKLNGPYSSYNEAGDLIEACNYKDDLINGNYFEYYDGKTVKTEAVYINGKIQGTFKRFFSNKVLERETIYEDGKIKKSIYYFANGKKSSESIYNDKEELETYSYFDIKEIKYFEEKYSSGELKSGLQYSKNNPKPVEINLTKKSFVMNNFDGDLMVTGNFEKGRKIKEWNYNYSSGILRLKEMYSQGKQNGLSHDYDRNGLIGAIKNYTNDTINGLYEVYENGKLDRVFSYADGKQNGPYKTFYPSGSINTKGYIVNGYVNFEKNTYWQNGAISSTDKFIADITTYVETYNLKGEKENTIDYKNKTGKFTTSYNNGTTVQVYEMVNGEFNGKFIAKDKLGNPVSESEYINGVRHNSYKGYSPLGTVYTEYSYYSGKLNGIGKHYDLVGNLKLLDESAFGDEHGKTTRFYYNKSKMLDYNKLNGSIDGEYNYFNQKGESILTIGYQNNSIKYYIRKNKTGELNEKVEITGETAEIASYYPNGKTAIKLNFVKGSLEGKLIINNMEGKPEFESNYTKNLLDGERIEYYANGNVYKREKLINGNYEGIQEYFKEDKKPWITAEYKNDQLHGNTLIYNNGTLILTKKYDSYELVGIVK